MYLLLGANGQTGRYLYDTLQSNGKQVICTSRSQCIWADNPIKLDVTNYDAIIKILKAYRPNHIILLAANSSTRHDAILANQAAIGNGTTNVLEAAYHIVPEAKVFIAGSGFQFLNKEQPISETDQFNADDPYSANRIGAVYMARYYRKKGLRTYVGYLFHHESKYRNPNIVSKKIVDSAVHISRGGHEMLVLGDTTVIKEWTFAGDVAEGILHLMDQEKVFEATIGSGIGYTIHNWVELVFSMLKLSWADYMRTVHGSIPEYRYLVSNPTTINNLGWKPKVSFEELAEIMIHGQHSKDSARILRRNQAIST